MTTQADTAVRERLLEQVRDYLMTQRGIAPDRVHESTHFRDDLDLDSLDLAALAIEWEDDFGITVDDEQIVTVTTVGKAIDLVVELTRTA